MRVDGNGLEISASDLATHVACAHATALDLRAARGELARPHRHDPALERLRRRGREHERAYVAHLRERGLGVVDLAGLATDEARARTLEALRGGADVVVQAVLAGGGWLGIADVLRRAPGRSALGAFTYEVEDTKLAQETRAGSVLQLCLYAELLRPLLGAPAATLRIVKPGDGFPAEELRFGDVSAWFRRAKRRLAAALAAGAEPYPEPVSHCDVCRWFPRCDARWRADDHLSLVAGMRRLHAEELASQRRDTLAALARAPEPLDAPPARGHRAAFDSLWRQARVQLRGREEGGPRHELREAEPGRGLARLPEPSAGDVFLDFEGDPFVRAPGDAAAAPGGLEYLLGHAWVEGGERRYAASWALERAAEKRALERFVDLVRERIAREPGAHVYHYAPYEPAALKRLASRHATRERELDELLRAERFVDLYAVVRQGLRASVESYSLKALEAHYGFERAVELREVARPALERVAAALEDGAPERVDAADRAAVEGYNRDDCVSLIALRAWLEERRAELIAGGAQVARPTKREGTASEAVGELDARIQDLFERLTDGLPADPAASGDEERARALLANLVGYFRRESRVAWWEYFARRDADDEELLRERKALVGLEFVEALPTPEGKKVPLHRYRFPPQEVALEPGDSLNDLDAPVGQDAFGSVHALDVERGLLDVTKRMAARDRHPRAVHEYRDVNPRILGDSLHALAEHVLAHGVDSADAEHRAARDLLLARPPRLRAAATGSLARPGEEPLAASERLARALDGGVLVLQGPPGSGKTYVGARTIVALAREGAKVGVLATSHKVVRNLLEEVLVAAREQRVELHATQKSSDLSDTETLPAGLHEVDDNAEALDALARGHVVGGVAWLWARKEAGGALDYLFLDEAGQMSLASALACARAARNLVLLGDPQQLQQPQRGAHPDGADVSALEHLLGGAQTIAPERGLFLPETFRLAPRLCAFTSELYYESRLRPRAGCERQELAGPTRFAGSGFFLVPVAHEGNQSSSHEEVAALARVLEDLLRPGVTWTDREGRSRPLTRADVLVVAPYNAQVAALARSPAFAGVAVGTVDRFQGQERAVVLYSLASSSAADAPRGLPFLYDPHRLNVATSRARCACIVAASPRIFEPECRTPAEMRLANGMCALAELARVVEL